jgi:gamma-glutamyl:cysteine ligase YbdK (ATP-grasp superfamily)
MGRDIERTEFVDEDYAHFAERLACGLTALEELLRRPGFGVGTPSIGAEVELCLVDRAGRPLPLNRAVLANTLDPKVALELNRFNLEFNTSPVALEGRPFSALGADLQRGLALIQEAASIYDGCVVNIGILPTLQLEDLQSSAMTDLKRYQALSMSTRKLRHAPFRVDIHGDEHLSVDCDDVTLEGANTSLQLHLRVCPHDFARAYNAAQIATAPCLAAATNSPIFLGRSLWEETRVALFRQAVDDRAPGMAWRPARVSFGHGWVREGAVELFRECVALHTPLLPIVGDEDPLQALRNGLVPALDELRLHNGTVWRWNRAVYDPTADGHLRIEMRALPAGPSIADMLANSAFLIGLTLGLAPEADWMVTSLPFQHAHNNFMRAARNGLDAELLWASREAPSPRPVRAADLIPQLLPVARRGLLSANVDKEEVDRLLGLIAARVSSRITGARWQRRVLAELEKDRARSDALAAMLQGYLACAGSGSPVHCWPIDV